MDVIIYVHACPHLSWSIRLYSYPSPREETWVNVSHECISNYNHNKTKHDKGVPISYEIYYISFQWLLPNNRQIITVLYKWPCVMEIHRWLADFLHKGLVMRKMFLFHDVIMFVQQPSSLLLSWSFSLWLSLSGIWSVSKFKNCIVAISRKISQIVSINGFWLAKCELKSLIAK